MNFIFGPIGYVFGYMLWFFYCIVKNYGVAIILFTIALKIIMFPLSVNQQKSMAKNAGMASKQAELKKKYGKDTAKLNEEMAKLYEKEGIKPLGGCLTTIVPLLLMLGVYYAVLNPLQNTLHIEMNRITKAIEALQHVPGVSSFFNYQYGQIYIIKHFSAFKDHLTMFSPGDIADMEFFSKGFTFLGIDLLGTPSGSSFSSMLWLIPVFCFLSSIATQIFTQKIMGNQVQQQGCMKYALYFMPLMSAYISYVVPAAVGFYWIISTMIGFLQTLVLNHFYSAGMMVAKNEAARIVLREEEEKKIQKINSVTLEDLHRYEKTKSSKTDDRSKNKNTRRGRKK